ncbi:OmpH family outer membrane protein [Dethiosulfatarculus sandiegensis]|uniref:OmpH family outer membrane protein n=1 Tax=Dethiosulfatarculus sandiegensis TaxID=1429043 RepID=UPI0018D0C5FA|nr:OmpH family outer membrane protein [Dethiosulfatarculus sandiegensis]
MIKTVLCLFCLGMFFPAVSQAGGVVWVVDLDRALSLTSQGKAVLAGVMEKADARETELRGLAKEIEILRKDLTVGGMLFSPEARQEKKRELKDKMRSLRRRQRKSLLELNQIKEDALAQLKARMLSLLAEMASAHKVSYVFKAKDLLYHSSGVDVTDRLVHAFNRFEQGENAPKLN